MSIAGVFHISALNQTQTFVGNLLGFKIILLVIILDKSRVYCTMKGCVRSFSTIGNLKRHLTSVHISKSFKCSLCDHVYTRSDNLKAHMRWEHLEKGLASSLQMPPEPVDMPFYN